MLHLLAFLFVSQSASWPPAQPRLEIHLVGAARSLPDRVRLTPAESQTAGAVWFPKQRVRGGFDAEFDFQITRPGGLGRGADGFAFVLQNQGLNALAGRGSAGGFALGDGQHDPSKSGIPHSIAVFFDTYRNKDSKDPSDNYVAVCTNGPVGRMHWPPNRLGFATKLNFRLKDGAPHNALIRYRPPLLTVALDHGGTILRVPVDVSTVTDHSGFAYVGFTASTGSGYENHDILTWVFHPESVATGMFVVQSEIRFAPTDCLEGKNLCTPAQAASEEKSAGVFHVVLPAHLAWAASIPNADARPVTISNASGSVCWPGARSDDSECSGPSGIASSTASGRLLMPGSPAGALVSKTEKGRTWFSANTPARASALCQGFYEFDVWVQ